jgi:signal peptidase II
VFFMTDLQNPQKPTRSNQAIPFQNKLLSKLPSRSAHLIFWSVASGALVLDLLTKWAVFDWLRDRSAVSIFNGVIRLIVVHNNGAAFGLFAGHPNWLIAVSFLALAIIICTFLFGGSRHKIIIVSLAFFAAGICGNLYDRLFNDGLVRDFIDVGINGSMRWPAFNLADAFLCVAVGLLMLEVYLTERPCRKRAQQQK